MAKNCQKLTFARWPLEALKVHNIDLLTPICKRETQSDQGKKAIYRLILSIFSRACLGFYPELGVKKKCPSSWPNSRSLTPFELKIYMHWLNRKVECWVQFERKSYKLGRGFEKKAPKFGSFLTPPRGPPLKFGFDSIDFLFKLNEKNEDNTPH